MVGPIDLLLQGYCSTPIGSKLLTCKVSTEPASRRLLRTLQVGDMQKKRYNEVHCFI